VSTEPRPEGPHDRIAEVLAKFNFARLRKALRGAGARWLLPCPGGVAYQLPTVGQLRERALALLVRLSSSERECMRDAGFVARRSGRLLNLAYELERVLVESPETGAQDGP
jgi:hypothetical protein